MSSDEKNDDIGNKKLLAIKEAFSEWRHLLEGAKHPVTVLTDLDLICSAKRMSSRQAHWSLFFSRFNFIILYRPVSRNGKAIALSRMLTELCQEDNPECIILPQKNFIWATSLKTFLSLLKEGYENDSLLNHPPTDINLVYKNGFWTHAHSLYVPESDWIEALDSSKLAGHFRFSKTEPLTSSFWWLSYKKDVKDVKRYVASCLIYTRSKTPQASPLGLLQPLPVASRPWCSISMDFTVDLPP